MNLRKTKSLLLSFAFVTSTISLNTLNSAHAVTASSYLSSSTVYAINTFTTAGSTENWTVPYGVTSIDAIAVGAGGGGGTDGGNGGGGGELRVITGQSVTPGNTLAITVGSGGSGAVWTGSDATVGGNTTLKVGATTILQANGGQAGVGWSSAQNTAAGGAGGSGGTGSNGGNGGLNRYQQNVGIGGAGSAGPQTTIPSGSAVNYGGGGGGGSCWDTNSQTTAGAGGGAGGGGSGAGFTRSSSSSMGSPAGSSGTANTGGGGGGGAACDGGVPAQNQVNQRTAGGAGGSGVVVIRYILSAPTTPAFPSGSDTGQSNSDRITASTSFSLTGTAVGGSSIQIYNGASAVGSPCTANVTTGAYSCALTGLTDGTYVFSAKASVSGGSAVASASSITVVIDATPPSLEPSSGISVAENQTSISTLTSNETVTMQMTDGVDSLTVNFNTSTGVLTFKQAQDYEAPADSNADRIYVVRIQVTDIAGNWRYRDISITLTNVNESSTLSAPSISSTVYKGVVETITVTINVSGKVRFFVGGKRISTCKDRVTSGSYPNNSATCLWKPPVTGRQVLTATLTPTDSTFSTSTSAPTLVQVRKRTTTR